MRLFSSADFFSKSTFKKLFQEHFGAQWFVSRLGPNHLQKFLLAKIELKENAFIMCI